MPSSSQILPHSVSQPGAYRSLIRLLLRLLLLFVSGSAVHGSAVGGLLAQTSPASSSDSQTHLVRGQVIHAVDGSPLPRALVTLNARNVLTDYQGRFEFAGFTGPNAFVSVRKPGFSANPEGPGAAQRIVDLDTPVLLKLYPDAVLLGTLTSQDGAPLSHVQIRLLRSQYDGIALRWVSAGSCQTDARGEYRISTPAGRFRLTSSFVQQSFDTSQTVLPVSFPEPNQSSASTLLELYSGEEKHADLRAKLGSVYPVALRIEPPNTQRMNLRVAVSTSAGDEFFAALSPDQHLQLPLGTYTLRVQAESRDESVSGSSRVTVTSHEPADAIIHLSPDAIFQVELLPGSLSKVSSTSNAHEVNGLANLPNVQQFNLSLHNQLAASEVQDQDLRLRPTADKSSSFRVPPGHYRLTASGGGQWHIQSATLGATDLLLNDLVVGSGAAGGSIRILVSNQTGTVHARTSLTSAASAWMYLLPRGPSLLPIHPITLTSDGRGALLATASVPAGAYTALLTETRLQEDPRDPAFLASYGSGPTDIEVQPDTDTSFTLTLATKKGADR